MDGYPHLDRVIGANTIRPLVKLGLLEADPTNPQRLRLSAHGRQTWELFLDRGGQYPEDLTSL